MLHDLHDSAVASLLERYDLLSPMICERANQACFYLYFLHSRIDGVRRHGFPFLCAHFHDA